MIQNIIKEKPLEAVPFLRYGTSYRAEICDLTSGALFKKTCGLYSVLRILAFLFEENEIETNQKKEAL